MTRPYVWHDSFICVTWLIHMCDMTRPYVWHDLFICVTWPTHMCDPAAHLNNAKPIEICLCTHYMCFMTCSYMWHDSSICVTWFIICVILPCAAEPQIWIGHVKHMDESCHTHGWVIWHTVRTQRHPSRWTSRLAFPAGKVWGGYD